MKALVIEGGRLRFEKNRPLPRRGGEALVRVSAAGICNTDIEILRGYMGFEGVPGHEFVGSVEEASAAALIGRRVVGEINCGCGECDLCRAGMARHCRKRTVLGISGRDGAFAEYLSLPEANLHTIPDGMPDDVATFVEPTAAAFEILEQVPVKPDDRCAVLGDGKLGLIAAQVLGGRCKVTLVGRHAAKLAVARQLGLRALAQNEFREKDFDVAIDATGRAEGLAAALDLLRPRGTLVLKTTVAGETRMPFARVVVDEITIIGSRCGPFEPAIEALTRGTVNAAPLVSGRFRLEDFEKAFARAQEPDALKVLLYPAGAP